MATTVLEGTWEEIAKHAEEFGGRRLRVTILEEQKPQPNQKMREIMKKVKEKQKDMRFTDGSKTQEMLRAARDGGMFGGELDE
jgi:3'-phosphoadenosine 5'-phosphosulfate sulfotransferase (PAPS reductase)/FAD synthetase